MSNQEETTASNSYSMNNDNVSVTVTKLPHCQVKFDIRVLPQATEAAYRKALKVINKEINIPGFRKGRAPEQLIVNQYGSTLQREFVDIVLQTAFTEAIHLTKTLPLKEGHITRPLVHECDRKKGAHFSLEFETRPIVPPIPLDFLKIKKVPPISITTQDRDRAFEQLLKAFTVFTPVEDRPVEDKDFVDLSVVILQEPPQIVMDNKRVKVHSLELPVWLRQKIIGLQVSESAEGVSEPDLTLPEPRPDFQPLPYRATVNAIWEGVQPTVDEELAKRVGAESLDDLYKKLDARLEREAQGQVHQQELEEIEQLLLEQFPLDIPQSYIDERKEKLLNNYLEHLKEEGITYTKEEYQDFDRRAEQEAIRSLRMQLLFYKIAMDHDIVVDQNDISEESAIQLSLLRLGQSPLRIESDSEKLREQLHRLALERKIRQFLLDHVQFIE